MNREPAKRRRWVRRFAFGTLAALVLGVFGFFGYRYRTWQTGQQQYAAVTAHLDATDPGWRLDPGDLPRGPVPDDQNSALIVARVKAALASGKFEVKRADGKYVSTSSEPPNRRLDDESWTAIDQAFEENYAALAIARTFKDAPDGWRVQPPGHDLFNFRIGDIADTRMVFTILNEEAKRLGRDGRPGAAFELVLAFLNAVRSIDGDIVLIDALVRIAGDAMVVGRVQGLLAQTYPRGGLGPLQAALAAEAESDFVWRALRGERALLHRTLVHIAVGRYPYRSALALDPKVPTPPGPKEQARDWAAAPRLPADHAEFLERATKVCEAARLPAHQQRAAMKAIGECQSPAVQAYEGVEAYFLAGKMLDAGLRVRALIRCAVVGVALERYRLRTGHWPKALADLRKDLLGEVPLDPFDGQPLRYVRRTDGVTVYSIGPDELDNGGEVGEAGGTGYKPMTDVCFRLYDPDQRGLPPLPTPPPDRIEIDEPTPLPGLPVLPYPRMLDED